MNIEEKIAQYMENINIPVHMRTGILDYVMDGRATGHFLSSLFSNDLVETFAHADGQNSERIKDYVTLMYNCLPIGCWGSRDNYRSWIERKGINGN